MPFALSPGDSQSDVVDAINYLLSNFKGTVSADNDTGQVTGPTGDIVSYLYKYLAVKYADNYNGTLNFSDSPTNRLYYGLHNSNDILESTNPANYVWYQVTGGFGTTKFFWYLVTGGRQIAIQIATSKPADGYSQESGSAIDLDLITSTAFSPVSWVLYRVPNNNSAPTNAESQTAIGRNPFAGDICTINFNNGANSIQYKFDGTVWNVLNRYITGDIIKNLEGLDCAVSVVTHMDVNSTIAKPSYVEGRLFYDYVEKSLAYYNDANGITLNICQEEVVRVYNNTGTTILNSKIVYINGANGASPTVAYAQSNLIATCNSTIGMCTNDIPHGTYGYITISGIVHDLNTNVDSEGHVLTNGQELFLSSTVAGGFTNVAPLQPNFNISIGYVTFKSLTVGTVFIRIDTRPWYPSLELLQTGSGIALPTVSTVFVFPTVHYNDGFTYSTSTGEFTFNVSGTYTFNLTINPTPSAANKKVYFYTSIDTGAGFVIDRYSSRYEELNNGVPSQMIITTSDYYAIGTKVKFYLWSDATVTLNSVDLPGTTPGTVTSPAARITWA
jgi:hypothetical protein